MCLPRIFLFLWILYISYTDGFLQIEGQNKELIDVFLKDGGRQRRSINGLVHSETYDLDLSLSRSIIHLHLTKNVYISSDVPLMSLRAGVLHNQNIEDDTESIFYQDSQNGAVFVVQQKMFHEKSMFGTFIMHGEEYILQTQANRTIEFSNGPNRFEISKMAVPDLDYKDHAFSDLELSEAILTTNNTNHRHRRAANGVQQIELLMVADYAVYKYWYDKSSQTTSAGKESDALTSVRQYYAFVITGMDGMYKNIQTSAYTVDLIFAGIVIAQTAGDAHWTETIKVTSVSPNQVDSLSALSNFNSWIQSSSSSLPGHDHAMLFTRYDLTAGGSTSNAGLAYLSRVCTTHSQSIVEDRFDFIIITVASHELGHSLGASHDGEGNNCSLSDYYIMAASSSPQTDSTTATHPWIFSSCSTAYFTTYINSLDSSNNNCMKSLSVDFDPTKLSPYDQQLPGQLYNADQQCQHIRGNNSYFCNDRYSNDFSTLCNVMWCVDPADTGSCSGYIAGDGTQCGNNKWCISGSCVSDPSAPTGDESCLYGDKKGIVFLNGWTCQDMVQTAPNNCQQAAVTCCASCVPYITTTTPAITTSILSSTTTAATTPTLTTTEATTPTITTSAAPTTQTTTTTPTTSAIEATTTPSTTTIAEKTPTTTTTEAFIKSNNTSTLATTPSTSTTTPTIRTTTPISITTEETTTPTSTTTKETTTPSTTTTEQTTTATSTTTTTAATTLSTTTIEATTSITSTTTVTTPNDTTTAVTTPTSTTRTATTPTTSTRAATTSTSTSTTSTTPTADETRTPTITTAKETTKPTTTTTEETTTSTTTTTTSTTATTDETGTATTTTTEKTTTPTTTTTEKTTTPTTKTTEKTTTSTKTTTTSSNITTRPTTTTLTFSTTQAELSTTTTTENIPTFSTTAVIMPTSPTTAVTTTSTSSNTVVTTTPITTTTEAKTTPITTTTEATTTPTILTTAATTPTTTTTEVKTSTYLTTAVTTTPSTTTTEVTTPTSSATAVTTSTPTTTTTAIKTPTTSTTAETATSITTTTGTTTLITITTEAIGAPTTSTTAVTTLTTTTTEATTTLTTSTAAVTAPTATTTSTTSPTTVTTQETSKPITATTAATPTPTFSTTAATTPSATTTTATTPVTTITEATTPTTSTTAETATPVTTTTEETTTPTTSTITVATPTTTATAPTMLITTTTESINTPTSSTTAVTTPTTTTTSATTPITTTTTATITPTTTNTTAITTTTLVPITTTKPTSTTTTATTTTQVPGEYRFQCTIRIEFVVTIDLTNTNSQAYRNLFNQILASLTSYYSTSRSCKGRFKKCNLRNIKKGSLIADHEVILNEDSGGSVIAALDDLLKGERNLTVGNETTEALSATIEEDDGSYATLTPTDDVCSTFNKLNNCHVNSYCAVDTVTNTPYCLAVDNDNTDKYSIILGLAVGIPLSVLLIVMVIIACVVCNRMEKAKDTTPKFTYHDRPVESTKPDLFAGQMPYGYHGSHFKNYHFNNYWDNGGFYFNDEFDRRSYPSRQFYNQSNVSRHDYDGKHSTGRMSHI